MRCEPRNTSRNQTAFSRTDLVAIVGVISLLGCLTFSSLAGGQRQSHALVCLSHLKAMTRAWALYAQDNDDNLVAAGRYPKEEVESGAAPPDWTGGQWLDLPENKLECLDPFAPEKSISTSPLWNYAGQDPRIWRCPSDPSHGSHPHYREGRRSPRVRSYGINCWAGGPRWYMSGQEWIVHKKLTEFINPGPSETLVFVDEREDSIRDGHFAVDMNGFNPTFGKNRSSYIQDYPSYRHQGAGTLSFVDGHAELHTWKDPRTKERFYSGVIYRGPPFWSPNNPDLYWMQQHATRKLED